MKKSVYGVGYVGEGNYKSKVNGRNTQQYDIWHSMMTRCYSSKYQEKQPTYKGCVVSEEWHNFQVFAKWYDENYYQVEDEKMNLDKDILIKGNKIYSPSTCIFVPQRINRMFTKSDVKRGIYPIGVSFDKRNSKYQSYGIGKNGKRTTLGCFNSAEEAFAKYKECKENYIKELADKLKEKIPSKLYNAMVLYKVEISD